MSKQPSVLIKISEQQLYLRDSLGNVIRQYPVSTSKYGTGNQSGSFRTPLGEHRVREKIGAGAAEDEVFVGRQSIGLLHELQAANQILPEDVITSRILWLDGLEPGVNQGGEVDSYQRYIYIHGTSEEDKIGLQASHGCIRMRNKDVIELYDLLDTGCLVTIEE